MSKFCNYMMKDLFSNDLVPCTEEDFDTLCVEYRSLYQIRYYNDHQDFVYVSADGSESVEFRRYYVK